MSSEKRITTLDGLRGIAVISVISFHYVNNQLAESDWAKQKFGFIATILEKSTYFGWAGVNLFFILSGFLIGNILLKNRHADNFYKTFYMRRFCRIIPAYYLLLLVYLVLTRTQLFNPEAYIFNFSLPISSYFLFIQNFWMAAHNTFGPQALTPTWSLCVEEQFYLIVPLLVAFVPPKSLWVVVLMGCGIALYSRSISLNFYQGYVLLPSRIDSPMIGLLIAWLHQKTNWRDWAKNNVHSLNFILSGLITLCALLYAFSDPGIFSHLLLALIFALVVAIALYAQKGIFVKTMSSPILIYIGKTSYFVYLFHQLINGLLHLAVLGQLKPVIENYQSIWLTVLALGLTFLLAEISFRWFEQPFVRFSHRFNYQESSKLATS